MASRLRSFASLSPKESAAFLDAFASCRFFSSSSPRAKISIPGSESKKNPMPSSSWPLRPLSFFNRRRCSASSRWYASYAARPMRCSAVSATTGFLVGSFLDLRSPRASSSSSWSSRRRLLAFASRLDGSLSAYRGSSSPSSSPARRFLGFLGLAPPGCCEDPPPPPPLVIAPSSRLFWCLVAQDCLCAALSALACLRIVLRSSTDFFPATGLGLPPISSQPLVPSSPSSS